MKKLLSILGVIILSETSLNVISCYAPNIKQPPNPGVKIDLTQIAEQIATIDGSTLFLNDSINDEALELIRTFLPDNVDIDYSQTAIYAVGSTTIFIKIWQTNLTTNYLTNVNVTITNINPKPSAVDLTEIAAKLLAPIDGSNLFSGQKNSEISNILTSLINDIRVKVKFDAPNDLLAAGNNYVTITLIDRIYLANVSTLTITVENVQLAPINVDLNTIAKKIEHFDGSIFTDNNTVADVITAINNVTKPMGAIAEEQISNSIIYSNLSYLVASSKENENMIRIKLTNMNDLNETKEVLVLFGNVVHISATGNLEQDNNYDLNNPDDIRFDFNFKGAIDNLDLKRRNYGGTYYNGDYRSATNDRARYDVPNFNADAEMARGSRQLFLKANPKNIAKFNNFLTQNNTWSSYQALQTDLLNISKIDSGGNGIDLDKIIGFVKNKTAIQQQFLKLYNVLAKIMTKQYALKLLLNIIVTDDHPIFGKGDATLATTRAWLLDDKISYVAQIYRDDSLEVRLNNDNLTENYLTGWVSSPDAYHIIFHKTGHAIDFFNKMPKEERQNLLVTPSFDPAKLYKGNISNRSSLATVEKDGVLGRTLMKYLVSKVTNYNFPSATPEQLNWLIGAMIVNSNYGISPSNDNDDEFFAEAFSQWLLTPDEFKNRGWELLNQFFKWITKIFSAK